MQRREEVALNEHQIDTRPLISEIANDTDLTDLLEEFVAELKTRVIALEKACAEKNYEILELLSHQIVGTAGLHGYPAISNVASELGNVIRIREEINTAREYVMRLRELSQRAQAGLESSSLLMTSNRS